MQKENDNGNVSRNGKVSKIAIEDHLAYRRQLENTLASPEGMLANEFAVKLQDTKNIRYYISVCHEYSEQHLREIFRLVLETPERKIKKSRGALFAYLIKKYGHLDTYN